MDKVIDAEEFEKLARKFELSIKIRAKAERFAKYLQTNGYGTVPQDVIESVSEIPPPPKKPRKKPKQEKPT